MLVFKTDFIHEKRYYHVTFKYGAAQRIQSSNCCWLVRDWAICRVYMDMNSYDHFRLPKYGKWDAKQFF